MVGAFKTYDEQIKVNDQNEINFDETLGGMCAGVNAREQGFDDYSEDCPSTLDVDNDGNDQFAHALI